MVNTIIGYPGGKQRLAPMIVDMFVPGTKVLVSPFIGGGSVELEAVSRGMTVAGSDLDHRLVNFWQVLLNYPVSLEACVRKFLRRTMSKSYFTKLKNTDPFALTEIERAAIFYIINKTSFSNIGYAGSYCTKKNNRLGPEALKKISRFRADGIWVYNADYEEVLRDKMYDSDTMIYCDPPYPDVSRKLYVHDGSDFDHQKFAHLITAQKNWIVSYYDTPAVRYMFQNFSKCRPDTEYCCNNTTPNRKGNELLIVSDSVYGAMRGRDAVEWVE